jgi:DNA-directed RNA polymerase subunit N (RpoN/RPB10)
LAKPDVVVQDVVCQKLRGDTSELVNVLQQLNLYQSSVKTFLVPGKTTIQAMLEELGVDTEQARRLTVSCVEAVDGYRGKTNP